MSVSILLGAFLLTGCGDEPAPGAQDNASAETPEPTVAPGAGLPAMPLGAEPSPRLSKDNGFRNVQMGQDRESIEGLQRRKMWDDKALGLRAYAMKKEYKLVGAATVERIIYRFLDDQVYSIEVLGEGLMACDTLLAVLTEMYGPGKKGQSGYDQMTWWGEDVTLMFTSMVDCSAEYIWLSKYREIVVGEGSTAAP